MKTSRSGLYRQQVVDRNGVCVVTGGVAQICDAAHIIPRSKKDKVCYLLSQVIPVALIRCDSIFERVVLSRRHLYPELDIEIAGINDVRNGTLLAAHLHRMFGSGQWPF